VKDYDKFADPRTVADNISNLTIKYCILLKAKSISFNNFLHSKKLASEMKNIGFEYTWAPLKLK